MSSLVPEPDWRLTKRKRLPTMSEIRALGTDFRGNVSPCSRSTDLSADRDASVSHRRNGARSDAFDPNATWKPAMSTRPSANCMSAFRLP